MFELTPADWHLALIVLYLAEAMANAAVIAFILRKDQESLMRGYLVLSATYLLNAAWNVWTV